MKASDAARFTSILIVLLHIVVAGWAFFKILDPKNIITFLQQLSFC